MVLVEIDSNSTHLKPMKNCSTGDLIRAYQAIIDRLNAAVIYPKHHILDNKILEKFKEAIRFNKTTYQLVPPNDHR